MALRKEMAMPNGVVTDYHRVALLSIDVNNQNTVLVHSYVSEDGRQVERDHAAERLVMDETNRPYVDARYLNCPYDGEMDVAGAYAWLKSLPEFEGAEDC